MTVSGEGETAAASSAPRKTDATPEPPRARAPETGPARGEASPSSREDPESTEPAGEAPAAGAPESGEPRAGETASAEPRRSDPAAAASARDASDAPERDSPPSPSAPPAPVVISDRRGSGLLDLFGRLVIALALAGLTFVLARKSSMDNGEGRLSGPLSEAELAAIATALQAPEAASRTTPSGAPQAGAGGRLVSFGPGRALYADGDGRFLIVGLRADGQLAVERAVELVRDPRRLHGRKDRSPHHYYFEDVGEALAARIATLKAELDRLLSVAGADKEGRIREVDRVTRRLAGFHAVDHLIPLLSSERFYVRRAAAMALAGQGYLIGFPTLIFAIDDADPDRRRRIHEAINALSGETIVPRPGQIEVEDAAARASAWWEQNPRRSPYALGVKMEREIERRLRRGL